MTFQTQATVLTAAVLLLCPCLATIALAQPASLQPLTLYSFPNPSGSISGVVHGANGVLYGTTHFGGAIARGSAFALTPPRHGSAWTGKTIASFTSDSFPNGAIYNNGNLYTTTLGVGSTRYGSVVELTPPATGSTWTQVILHDFTYNSSTPTDGAEPQSPPVIGKNGVLYGTTAYGGIDDVGTAFELTPPAAPGGAWTEKVIHQFTDNADGGFPSGALAIGTNGVLYGATTAGASPACLFGCGTVFELVPPSTPGGTWTLRTIYSFMGGMDGDGPYAGLAMGAKGVLYGATQYGGTGSCPGDPAGLIGCGTVFELTPPAAPGAGWTEQVIYTFMGGPDGANPTAVLAVGNGGVLYGATPSGGISSLGTLFSLTPPASPGGTWTEAVYSFTGLNGDGSSPAGGLTLGANGVLFGATSRGGVSGNGTLFQVTP
jgi:hypothetical protein